MRVLVTGASGYIGKKIIERLVKEGHSISVVVRKNSNIDDVKKYIDKIIYFGDDNYVYEQINAFGPQCYINVAGKYYGAHNPTTIREMMGANMLFPALVLDAAVASGCMNVIHTSTVQQCYDGEQYNPVNFYAATKQAFEDVIRFYAESGSIKAITLQLFDTYGADDTRNKIFNRIRKLKKDEAFELSSGRQKMYFCYIDDVIDAYIEALELVDNAPLRFNKKYAIRSDEPIELKAFVEKYSELLGCELKLDWGKIEHAERDILDPTGYGDVLPNWQPKYSYEDGIKLCVKADKL